MKNLFMLFSLLLFIQGCASSKDLAQTLRYSDNSPVGVSNIAFHDLQQMKRGDACTWNIFYYIPLSGDGSIITAASNGSINNVELIGETGRWYFPLSKNCTVVFGDNSDLKNKIQ